MECEGERESWGGRREGGREGKRERGRKAEMEEGRLVVMNEGISRHLETSFPTYLKPSILGVYSMWCTPLSSKCLFIAKSTTDMSLNTTT